MTIQITIDVGNTFISIGIFDADGLKEKHKFLPVAIHGIKEMISPYLPSPILIASVNDKNLAALVQLFNTHAIDYSLLSDVKVPIVLDVDQPELVGEDRLAAVFGALQCFPQNTCIVVDIGNVINYEVISPSGIYHGGAIFPGLQLQANSLHLHTEKLPQITPHLPEDCIGRTTRTQIESGIFYGTLGAIERTISELKFLNASPSSVKVIATGGMTDTSKNTPLISEFVKGLSEFADLIHPHLTLVGLNEILKELSIQTKKENQHEQS